MSDLWRDMDFALPAGHPSTWEQECKQLRAENERLRAALGEIDVGEGWAALIARAALKGTKT